MDFEIDLIYLIKRFLLHDQKVMTATWKRKELLRENKNHFPSYLKGFQ